MIICSFQTAKRFGITYSQLRFLCRGRISAPRLRLKDTFKPRDLRLAANLLQTTKVKRIETNLVAYAKLSIRYRILSPDVICFVLQNNEFWLGFLEMATLSIRIGISIEAKHCHPEDENSYLTSSCNPRKHWILATLWDPLIPDPAFDRHFASYWMDQLQSESSIQKNGEKSNFYNFDETFLAIIQFYVPKIKV